MAILGAHMSIVGGYHMAVVRAHQLDCNCVQLFTKNGNQWRDRDVTDQEARQFAAALAELRITHPLAHDSYLINLASPNKGLWQKSVHALAAELRRADRLGIPYVVVHPGAATDHDESGGIGRVIRALDQVHRRTRGIHARTLLETTAGQGTSLGWRFEHLAAMLHGSKEPDRLGICFDTCHVFAAGYPLGTEEDYEATMRTVDATVGIRQIKAFHLNDSSRAFGSRVDRHAHIGRGRMGLEPFRLLLHDPRFVGVPMYLETPKGLENGVELDTINLRTLRSLTR